MQHRSIDIIVGGAGDRYFRCARRYADELATQYPERDILYLPQGKRRALLRAIMLSDRPNLIGHSWGAADVSWAARQTNAPLGCVIGVDAVGKPGPWRSVRCAFQTLISIRGTGSENRLSDGNFTATVGRWIGHPFPEVFKSEAAIRIDAPYAHYDMTRMMRFAGDDGRSAEDILLDR